MAKSARASSRKANNQRLKQKVFGPVDAARTERLAAKLAELVETPKPSKEGVDGQMDVVSQDAESTKKTSKESVGAADEDAMDVDTAGGSEPRKKKKAGQRHHSRPTHRVQKRMGGRKSVTFRKRT